jgi:hypothetical protein
VQLNGDLEYLAKWLGAPRWSNHTKFCAICRATYRGVLSWHDNRPTAEWIRSLVTTGNWQGVWTTICKLFDIPGLSSLSIAYDFMHNCYLGWLQYFFGSILFYLLRHVLEGDALTNLMDVVAPFIRKYQRDHDIKHRYRPNLTKLTMFEKKKSYPRLRGRAADIRRATSYKVTCDQCIL